MVRRKATWWNQWKEHPRVVRWREFLAPRPLANQHSVAIALQQYALMLNAGLGSADALDVLAKQSSDPIIKAAFEDIAHNVIRNGHTVSSMMNRHRNVFTATTVLLVRAAEESGDLADRLNRAGQLIERTCRLQSKVKESLVSPAVTTLACLTILFCIARFVLPKFLSLYSTMNVQLPIVSQVVIGCVYILNHPLFLVALILGIMLARHYRSRIREFIFEKALQYRLTRTLLGSMLAVQFVDVLGTTLRSGIPLQRALELLRATAPYEAHAREMGLVAERLRSSGSLSEAVEGVPYFPSMIHSMLSVGEETGHLDDLLKATGSLLDEQNTVVLGQLVMLIEPCVIAFMGVVMGVICVGMFLPIYGLLSQLG